MMEDKSMLERENIDSQDLHNLSGGLALQGILLTKQLDDLLKERKCLLQIPEVVVTEAQEKEAITKFFNSSHEEVYFKKKLAILGYGFAMSTVPVYGGVTINYSHEKTNSENDPTYFSTVKYSPAEIATYSFKRTHLKLSKEAIVDLKELLKILGHNSADNVYEKCTQFFNKYGSHANLGPLTYGGNLLWTCSSTGISENNIEMLKDLQLTIVNSASMLACNSENEVEIDKKLYEDKYTVEMLESAKLKVEVSGGSKTVPDISQWNSELAANKRAWALNDRGKRLIAVWDIIKINYEQEFRDLIKVLKGAWEKLTDLVAEQDLLELLKFNKEDELAQIEKWNKEKKPTLNQIVQRLEHLLQVKKDILSKRNLSFWITSYIFHPSLQTFFLSVVNEKFDSESTKSTMKELLEFEELDQESMEEFPSIKKVFDWLYQSHISLEGFNDMLKKAVEEFKHGSRSQEGFTRTIEKEVRRLRLYYQKKCEDILISILVYPFQSGIESSVRLRTLTFGDIESLSQQFSSAIKKFKTYETSKLHLQCYLLLMAINCRSVVPHFKSFVMKIIQMMREVQPPPEVKRILQSLNRVLHDDSADTLEKFKQFLESLLKSSGATVLRQPSVTSVESLRSALLTKMIQRDLAPTDIQTSVLKKNPTACEIFAKLGLSKHYPKQLKLEDAFCIRLEPLQLSLSGSPPADAKQLPYLILHKLMSYDSKCISDLMPTSTTKSDDDDDDDDDGDDEDEDNDADDANDSKKEVQSAPNQHLKGVHPVDCLLSLILCSDDFLCQDLYSRLAKCQLAVPLLIPDPFSKHFILRLMAMHSIIKEWKVVKKSGEVDECVHPLIDYPMPIVSFLRVGKYQPRGESKSKILNMVISESNHDFYFHRDRLVGQYDRVFGEGLVELCWYLPTGKTDDPFSDAIAFLNLRGDARHHTNQTRFLGRISSMCFILFTEENLKLDTEILKSLKYFNESPGGICILKDVQKKPKLKKEFSSTTFIDLPSKTSAQIKNAIQTKIKEKLMNEGSSGFSSIRKLCTEKFFQKKEDLESKSSDLAIIVDEKNELYQESLKHANKLINFITGHKHETLSVKEAMLPLHGEGLWKAWATCDKELHRHILRGNKSVNEYTAIIEADKASLRAKQLKYVDSMTPVMDSFIRSLLSLGGPCNRIVRNYFLQSIKLELNSLSRANISGMQHQYHCKRKDLSLLQTKSVEDAEKKSEELKKDLKALQGEIINFSFGLEHLLRELGQVYEAALESQEYDEYNLSRLPKAAAELLIDGYPIELMDGDAAHVPLDWITAVLKQTGKILEKNTKVFVVSVLGLQSTGKSTMLNAAFGVQFNVSAGRCTRGAFMQLLSLDEEMKQLTGCSYVLIVDTEGLRAPELDPLKTQKHDNELATFVIGLANVTLINIYGEVPGDMDDILQTAVHAFLRMTEIKYHPSCQFVHQNAGANIKNEVGRAKFTQKLNQFTLDAAKEEQREGQYRTFNDVINFDDQTDVHYFPGLWKGDPPMAPINEGYSSAAQSLKHRLVEIIRDRASSSELSLSSFHTRVNDLWNTLLKEKFVFSFKNTLEITAYNSLETSYSQWAWTFQEAMLKWEQEAENEITAENPDNLSDFVPKKIEAVREYASKLYQPLKEKMEEFFSGSQSEILIQWKADFEIRLSNLLRELVSHAEEHCNKLLSSKQAISQFKAKKIENTRIIRGKIQDQLKRIKKEQEDLNIALEKRDLKEEQLKKLLKRGLFTSDKLKEYVKHQLITSNQEIQIRGLSHPKPTEISLKNILVGGILAEDQVKSILKKTRSSDEELRSDFETIWKDMTSSLTSASSIETVHVEEMIAAKLYDFVRAKGSDGILISKLQEVSLREWGTKFEFPPEKDKHFESKRSTAKQLYYKLRQVDPDQQEANQITQQVFSKVCACVQKLVETDTDFKAAFTLQLLNMVESEITEQSKSVKDIFTFTKNYRIEMYLIACGYALPKFMETSQNPQILCLSKVVAPTNL